MAAEEWEHEEIDNEAMISTRHHYGLVGLVVGISGTILGLWQLFDAGSTASRELGTALVVLCPLIAVLATVSLRIARKMRAELGQNTTNKSHR